MAEPRQTELAQPVSNTGTPSRTIASPFILAGFVILFAILTVISGAFTSELSGETDEAAHYVTGLLARDYVLHGLTQGPLTYAANFYLHYPKVGLGHWPPLFYAIQALWMMVFGDSLAADIALMMLLTAVFAWLAYEVARRAFQSQAAAVGCGLLALLLPVVQMYGRMIMADLPVAVFIFAAAWAWIRFMEVELRRYAVYFALLSSAAILTKGNGYALAFVPGISIALCRRWRLIVNRDVWLAGGIVALCTVPWNLITRDLIVPTMQHSFGTGFFWEGGAFYLEKLLTGPGLFITALALLGIVVKVVIPLFRSRVEPVWATLLAVIISVHLFHVLVPAGKEIRYLLPSYAAMILFMGGGIEWICGLLSGVVPVRYSAAAAAAVVAIVFFATVFYVPRKRAFGFNEIGETLTEGPLAGAQRILCASTADGEGLLVSEIARRDRHRPQRVVARGTQMFATMDWNGRDYRPLVQSADDVRQVLNAIPAEVVVFDRMPSGYRFPHDRLLDEVLHSSDWERVGEFPKVRTASTVRDIKLELYRWAGPPRTGGSRLRVELSPKPRIVLDLPRK